jgi:methylenetetrahydromethanopterin dehydrogenase
MDYFNSFIELFSHVQCDEKMVKVTIVKTGYIATTTLIDALLDERASRENVSVRVVSSGCKMDKDEAADAANIAAQIPTDLYVIISPNAGLPGPSKIREVLKETGKPIIIVSDEPSRKKAKQLGEEEGIGYLVLYGDPMIGAKRPFLDPVEMALVHSEIDRVIEEIEQGKEPELPMIVVNKTRALKYSGLKNPYARAKAMAAFEAARKVANLDVEGCFKTQGAPNYLPIIAAAHELLRSAAILCDEAREIEKANDSVERLVHFKDGALRKKTELLGKFE